MILRWYINCSVIDIFVDEQETSNILTKLILELIVQLTDKFAGKYENLNSK